MKIFISAFLFLFILNSFSQTAPVKTTFIIKKQAVTNYDSIKKDYSPSILIKEMPVQGPKKKEFYAYPEQQNKSFSSTNIALPSLVLGKNFFGNGFNFGTPNDNDMAISDSGIVVSVINKSIFIRNTKTNVTLPGKSLAAFTTPINNRHEEFDPKVMYDPRSDKFVLVCLVGYVDSTSKIIVGFSQTNSPNGNWNLYALPGNPLNNNLWSDYPMIGMTEKELFLSINLLTNNSSWQTGFVETLVWQMKKDSGYAGLPIHATLHSNIKFNGKAIRNLCPAKGGKKLHSPNMYFISNRNLANQNDTVFLVNVTDTIGSPSNTVTTKALISNQTYYMPPDGRQPIATESLATNDARNLGAFYENNIIQYVHNTNNPANNHSTIYYGVISNPQSAQPSVAGYIMPNDSMDFAYPNISYAGNSPTDNTSIISFDHSSDKVFPGCSAIRTDGTGNFSDVLRIRNGVNYINLLNSGQERWGDYSGSQRKYNGNGVVWMSGYYACNGGSSYPKAHAAWVAELKLDSLSISDTAVSYVNIKNERNNIEQTMVYPNPSHQIFSVDISLANPEYLNFQLLDAQGKLVEVLLSDWVKGKENQFSFSTKDLEVGIYFLKITGNYKTNLIKKIIIN